MTDPTEDRVVEAMARAMCIALDYDPDQCGAAGLVQPNWSFHTGAALQQYRAYLAMQSVLMDLKPVQAVSETTVPLCDHRLAAARRLDRALCNFCNGARDEYLPSEWRAETRRNLAELCGAYNEAHVSGLLMREGERTEPALDGGSPEPESLQSHPTAPKPTEA